MCAQLVLSGEEKGDPSLGYPIGYSKLCRNAHKQLRGLITPFTDGPPQRFLPYSAQEDEISRLKEFDACFPIIPECERDSPNARKYAVALWQQLDHLGNAGFDPEKFRVDPFGNVVYWNADPASPLFWEVDHWFPHSRGGKTVISNLRIVQWQVNQRKKERLEFLVPWWDLQLGISVNQFLSAFASKNADFRNRCFSYMFLGGESEQLKQDVVASTHSWPGEFRLKKSQFGLAPAALVKLQRELEDGFSLKSCKTVQCSTPGASGRRRWNTEEEEGLRRALQKFGPGSWKEIKESEPALVNRSTVQIKDKYRAMKGDLNLDKENVALEKQSCSVAASFQKEMQLKVIRDETKRTRQAEITQLQNNLKEITEVNAKEHEALEDLEVILNEHRKEVEKQRRWAETQSSYRLCLERMIRDTLHQTAVYKEQARLSQVTCNVLMAKLETENAARQAAELDMLTTLQQRKALMTSSSAYMNMPDVVDVSSCLSQLSEIHKLIHENESEANLLHKIHGKANDGCHSLDKLDLTSIQNTQVTAKPKQHSMDLEPKAEVDESCKLEKLEPTGYNARHGNMDSRNKAKEDEGLQVVVVGYEYEQRSPAGQGNVDKWLGMLLSDGNNHEIETGEEHVCSSSSSPSKGSKGILGLSGLLKRLSFKQQLERSLKKNAGGKKKKDVKEWQDLATEMGQIEDHTRSTDVRDDDCTDARDASCTELGPNQLDNLTPDQHTDILADKELYTEEKEEVVSCCSSFQDTDSTMGLSEVQMQQAEMKKGTSLLESLHDEEDTALQATGSMENSTKLWYFQDWNPKVQARNGLKQSLKLCTQTWTKAMKKLEVKIQEFQ